MSCCGKKRGSTTPAQASPASRATVVFEYVGRAALTVVGPATRTSYRFDRPGARVLVDVRDRTSLASIPVLRQVIG